MAEINIDRKKRRGRIALADPRTHCVSVRLNNDELAILNVKRGDMDKGEWMRCAALDKLPVVVPEPNKKKWQALARASSNLNQIAKLLNEAGKVSDNKFEPVRVILNDFRRALIGASKS